ncbi:hypothetical protein ACFCWY_19880 [Streptomyces sp. NPDC056362]|uniref:hypothetical protein n=1 Tax=unclassified Streptomyces TaxID=2593676 RepID=UPI0035E32D77
MTFPQAPALPEELDKLMRRMRLPYMRKAAPDVLATAQARRWDPAEVLRLLIAEEVTGRDAATRCLRRHSANFPTGKTVASWRVDPSGFDTVMPKTLAGASTDRLMHHAHLVTTAGDSHRLAEALAGKGVVPLN